MTQRYKPMHWTRWSITVREDDEPDVLAKVFSRYMREQERFHVTDVTADDDTGEVRVVVEYTARGANRNDIMRRLKAMNLTEDQVRLTQSATVNLDEPGNAELARAFGIEVVEDDPGPEDDAA